MEIRKLTVEFDGNRVINELDLDITESVVALMGPSGRGKTALLRAIAGLVEYSGEIIGVNHPVMLFQEDRLFPWLNVRQNAALFTKDASSVEYWLERLGLEAVKDSSITTLSGGMQRRVSLAAMLCSDGDVFLLDEPTRGLDEQNADIVMQCVLQRAQGKTVIFSTHSLALAQKYAQRIIDL